MWRTTILKIVEHNICRAHELLIAAHIISTPNEVARVALRHVANGCPLVAAEGEDRCRSLAQRWAAIVRGERREAALHRTSR